MNKKYKNRSVIFYVDINKKNVVYIMHMYNGNIDCL